MVYDSARGRTVLFGGRLAVSGANSNETWEWDGDVWTQKSPAVSPPTQAHGSMVFDTARGVCVFFGSGATWEYDGQIWVPRNIAGPSTRFHHSMAFDSVRGVTVLFGGSSIPSQGDALSDTWEYDGTTWTRLNSNSPPARSHHAMAFHASTGETLLFGGQPPNNRGTIQLADLWSWNGTSWVQKSPATRPNARTTHGLTYHAGLDRTILHGGWSNTAPGDSDTWMWDGSDWTRVDPAVSPLRRAWTGQQFVYDAARNECVIFGGCTAFPDIADTWTFDGSDWRPKLEFRVSPVNGHRYAMTPPLSWDDAEAYAQLEGWHLTAVRTQAEQSWLWSTYGPTGQGAAALWIGLNDKAQPGTFVWTSREPVAFTAWGNNQPSNGASENAVEMSANLVGSWNDRPSSDILRAIIEIPVATEIAATEIPTTNTPPGVARHAIAARPGGGALLFGGETASGVAFTTYELDGSSWSLQFPLINPLLRTGHTLLTDSARGNNLLFGGENPLGVRLSDTWTYANGQWTPLNPATIPTARSRHAMAYDANRSQGILFGGLDASGNPLSDTWVWNGSNWARQSPPQVPPARHGHGLAWDRSRGRVVMFGGTNGTQRLDDIWEWNGARWSQVVPARPRGFAWGPGPRSDFAMEYDPVGDRIVVHGGETDSGCEADFWSWDGVEWTLLSVTGERPAARSGHKMFVDPSGQELRLFGGSCDTTRFQDVWRIELPVLSSARPFLTGCSGSAGLLGFRSQGRSLPVLGQTYVAELTNAPAAAFGPAFVLAGFDRYRWAGGSLPLDLAIFGMPGCQLLTSPDSVFGMNSSSGSPSVAFSIPNDPVLRGRRMFLQGAAMDPTANAAGIVMSNGLVLRLGEQ